MIVVKRGKEPGSLLEFRKQNPDADYETDMPSDVLKDIRVQMWEEQRRLCAYCMKRIDSPGAVRIEHCKPRHPKDEEKHDKKATLDFKWMLLCMLKGGWLSGTSGNHRNSLPDGRKKSTGA